MGCGNAPMGCGAAYGGQMGCGPDYGGPMGCGGAMFTSPSFSHHHRPRATYSDEQREQRANYLRGQIPVLMGTEKADAMGELAQLDGIKHSKRQRLMFDF